MQTYDCIVNLCDQKGIPLTQVEKHDVSAPEVILLRHIHGADKVVKVRKRNMDKRPHSAERQRLVAEYGEPVVQKVFGPGHSKLPVEIGVVEEPEEDEKVEAAA